MSDSGIGRNGSDSFDLKTQLYEFFFIISYHYPDKNRYLGKCHASYLANIGPN